MRNLNNPTGKAFCLLEALGTYNLTVSIEQVGHTCIDAAALSRLPCSKCAKQKSGNVEQDCTSVTQTTTASITDDVLPDPFIPSRVVQRSPHFNIVLFKSTMAILFDLSIDKIKADDFMTLTFNLSFNYCNSLNTKRNGKSSTIKTLWRMCDRLSVSQSFLCRTWFDSDYKHQMQIVVPANRFKDSVHYYHDKHLVAIKVMTRR
ncbi:hypothetical protein DPMN_122788 [Dreissena polymorpha]|uniref:Uncharacterized protein n=1 Tax=Dreissena polymorpha TaxID=45954 RepID=A0A9D4JQW4_DREPO|nr:hypothetical protein DPMN_122788 [Dreissena polymorpha]